MNKFRKDLYRYFGDENISIKILLYIIFSPHLLYIFYFRMANNTKGVTRWFFRILLLLKSIKTNIQIPFTTKIGEGFYIGHWGRVIINGNVKIGRNVNIATGVTIGQTNRGPKKGCPVIGNNVWIGTNAVIVGNITIGDDVLIAPLSFVNMSIPDHSIVIGNPAKIIYREDATKDYINRTV